jgi:hypothetical protein
MSYSCATAKGKQLQCLELAITKCETEMFVNISTVILFRAYVRTMVHAYVLRKRLDIVRSYSYVAILYSFKVT